MTSICQSCEWAEGVDKLGEGEEEKEGILNSAPTRKHHEKNRVVFVNASMCTSSPQACPRRSGANLPSPVMSAAAVRLYYGKRQAHTFSREQRKSLMCKSSVMATIEVGTMETPITEKETAK